MKKYLVMAVLLILAAAVLITIPTLQALRDNPAGTPPLPLALLKQWNMRLFDRDRCLHQYQRCAFWRPEDKGWPLLPEWVAVQQEVMDGDYRGVVKQTEQVIRRYAQEAVLMQDGLTERPWESHERILSFMPLNIVGSAYMVKAAAHRELGETEQAIAAYQTVLDHYSYAQCFSQPPTRTAPDCPGDYQFKHAAYSAGILLKELSAQ